MSKHWRILLNLVILLLVAGFVGYMAISVSGGAVEYGTAEPEQADFVSPYIVEATYALPRDVQHLRLLGDTLYMASSDSVYLYGKTGVCLYRFRAEGEMVDIDVADGCIYALYPSKVKVFTPDGLPVREWEACSDNAGYCSLALTNDYVFVTDAENQNICQYTKDGNFVRFINSPRGFVIPSYTFAIESFRDTLYCVNSGRHQIESYTPDGKFVASFGIPGSKPGTFSGCCNPACIALTADGQLLTSEKGNPRVCLFERSGRFVRMLLNSKTLGGGHTAYRIQTEENKIYAAGNHTLTVYRHKDSD